ncbi:MAG TPA: methyltransferase domain-containing protein [Vicinamibacterales bacterium]
MSDRKPLRDPQAIQELVATHGRWWHQIEVAPGIVTPGDDSNRMKLPILDELGLPQRLTGRRVLDIGCSDGYFTFEAEKRGAEVTAMDFVPESYTGFATARRILDSRATYVMDNVYNLSPEAHGTFDVVLFLGVLYHLRKPLAALDAIRGVMRPNGELYVGTMLIDSYVQLPDGTVTSLDALNPALRQIPLWQAYPRDSLNGDYTNCFAPNMAALTAALEDAQFEVKATKIVSMGGYVRAIAINDPRTDKYQKLDSRLEKTAFDPSVPYFLDEEGSTHSVTGPHSRQSEPAKNPKPWWQFWR